jgi:hypothetical protein
MPNNVDGSTPNNSESDIIVSLCKLSGVKLCTPDNSESDIIDSKYFRYGA